jgi:glucosamine--fructose-6-phosphate aminotransferase (isomerizing)
MLKEIYEQPNVIKDTIDRLHANEGIVQMAGVEDNGKFLNADRIIIVACGTSWHAGLVAEQFLKNLLETCRGLNMPSEFRYRNQLLIVMYIAHSQVKLLIPWLLLNWQSDIRILAFVML